MKTLCAAAVVLSLASVCLSAPLTCETLQKPLDKTPNLIGRWYIIAMSSGVCLVPALLNSVLWPSIVVDFTAQQTQDFYNGNFTMNSYDICASETEQFLLDNSKLLDIDSDGTPTGDPDILLQTGCPDCLIIKGDEGIGLLLLLSRRQSVTAAELKEFETLTECLKWSKPQVLNTDHDYKNCKTSEDHSEADVSALTAKMVKRIKSTYKVPLECLSRDVFYYSKSAFEWIQEKWNNLW